MRIVICCGSDKSGKSVLAKQFTANGWQYFHFGPPKDSAYSEYYQFLTDVLKDPANKNKNFIIDRYMYCEFPYSKHFKRDTDMTLDRMNEIEDLILQLDPHATVIYCENDIDINWDLLQDEGRNDFASKNDVRTLRSEYRRILKWTHLNLVEYDYTRRDEPSDIYTSVSASFKN